MICTTAVVLFFSIILSYPSGLSIGIFAMTILRFLGIVRPLTRCQYSPCLSDLLDDLVMILAIGICCGLFVGFGMLRVIDKNKNALKKKE